MYNKISEGEVIRYKKENTMTCKHIKFRHELQLS